MTFFEAFAAIVLITCCLVTLVLYVRREQRYFDTHHPSA